MAPRLALSIALGVVLVALTPVAQAHPFSASSLKVAVDGARVRTLLALDGPTLVTVLARDLGWDPRDVVPERIEGARDSITSYLDAKLTISGDGATCAPDELRELHVAPGGRVVRVLRDFVCPRAPARLEIDSTLLMEDEGGHRVLVFAHLGSQVLEREIDRGTRVATFDVPAHAGPAIDFSGEVGTGGRPAARPGDAPSTPTSTGTVTYLRRFFVEGVWHILIGLDHVLFVLALVFAARGPKELAWLVTSFTAAHSVTLALGVLDVVAPPERLTESLIALSIVYVGVENALRPEPRARAGVTFAFGLVHGFGFSSVLRDLGLDAGQGLVPSLLGFNAGVEVGQLVLVLPAYPLLARLSRARPEAHRRLTVGVGGAVAALAALWFVERAAGVVILGE